MISKGYRTMVNEKTVHGFSGWLLVFVLIAVLAGSIYELVLSGIHADPWGIGWWSFVVVADSICFGGFTVVNPNEARVVLLFGRYKGTIKAAGFWWVNPFSQRRRV